MTPSRYQQERTKRLIWQNKRRAENRLKYWDWLSDKACVDCQESDIVVLETDHLKPKGSRKKAISLLVGSNRSWEFILNELQKCTVRCANCHRRKTAIELGYGKIKYRKHESR